MFTVTLKATGSNPSNNDTYMYTYSAGSLYTVYSDISWFWANPFRFIGIYFEISIRILYIRFVHIFSVKRKKKSTQYTPETLG